MPLLVRPRRARAARRLAGAHAARHRQRPLAVLDVAHARRVRGADVPAGGRGRSRGRAGSRRPGPLPRGAWRARSRAGCGRPPGLTPRPSGSLARVLRGEVARPAEGTLEARAAPYTRTAAALSSWTESHTIRLPSAIPALVATVVMSVPKPWPRRPATTPTPWMPATPSPCVRRATATRLVEEPDDPGTQPAHARGWPRRLARRRSASAASMPKISRSRRSWTATHAGCTASMRSCGSRCGTTEACPTQSTVSPSARTQPRRSSSARHVRRLVQAVTPQQRRPAALGAHPLAHGLAGVPATWPCSSGPWPRSSGPVPAPGPRTMVTASASSSSTLPPSHSGRVAR